MSTEWQKPDILIWYNFALAQAGKSYLNSLTWGWPEGNPNQRPPDLYFSQAETAAELLLQKLLGLLKSESRRGVSDHKCRVSPKPRGSCQAAWPLASAMICRASSSSSTTMHQYDRTVTSVPRRCALLLCSGLCHRSLSWALNCSSWRCGLVFCSSQAGKPQAVICNRAVNLHFSIAIPSASFGAQHVLDLFQ